MISLSISRSASASRRSSGRRATDEREPAGNSRFALADKSVELNPDYPSWLNYLWFHDHYRKGEYQQALEKMLRIRTEPGNFWNHAHLAQAYAQLGRKEDAAAEIKKLLAVYPDFAENARAQWKAWNWSDENTEMMLDGLRKAGLDIPVE